MRYTLAVLILVFHIGCAMAPYYSCPEPTSDQQAAAYYGAKPLGKDDAQNKMIIEAAIKARLKDPYSAKFRFREPYRGWIKQAKPCKIGYGYLYDVYVNAKNSYGGYTGEKRYTYLFQDGMLIGGCQPSTSLYSGTYTICVVTK